MFGNEDTYCEGDWIFFKSSHGRFLFIDLFNFSYEPTDHLNPGEEKNVKTTNDDDIEKILATSEVLKPDFMQKTSLSPYFVSKKKAKEIRKVSCGPRQYLADPSLWTLHLNL